MEKILRFLIEECSFLYKDYGMKITYGQYARVNGEAGAVGLSNDKLRVEFIYDRSQMLVTISNAKARKNSGYALTYIMILILGSDEYTGFINEKNNVKLLKDNFDKIIELFSPEKNAETVSMLKKIIKIEQKKMWG